MLKVIVTGGRNYTDSASLNRVLLALNPLMVIQGGATGADALAKKWAHENQKACRTVEADWVKHGRSAGPIRNTEMLATYPEAIVLAFPGGAGTSHCVKEAKKKGMLVLCVL